MDASTRVLVQERAGNCCEYCQLHQDDSPLAALHTEHIIPKKHGGYDHIDNRALACIDCNLHKGSNLTGIDPATNAVTVLFHPRRQQWRSLRSPQN
jgi:5-methylcytosine-specific restriction endonuclease McrA